MSICKTLIIAALAMTPSLACAQTQAQIERRYSRDYQACVDASEGVTLNLRECLNSEIDRQDARLNQAYVMVMRRLPAPRKTLLRADERKWITARDARCKRAIAGNNGTMAGLIYAGCILDETIKRTLFLETYKG